MTTLPTAAPSVARSETIPTGTRIVIDQPGQPSQRGICLRCTAPGTDGQSTLTYWPTTDGGERAYVRTITVPLCRITNGGPATPEAVALATTLRDAHEARERAEAAARAKDAFLDGLVADAHQYADDNDLCEVFDRFMADHGLPERTGEYEVEAEVTVTIRFRQQRTLTRAEAEYFTLDEDDVEDDVRDALNTSNYTIENVETAEVTSI